MMKPFKGASSRWAVEMWKTHRSFSGLDFWIFGHLQTHPAEASGSLE